MFIIIKMGINFIWCNKSIILENFYKYRFMIYFFKYLNDGNYNSKCIYLMIGFIN